MIAIIGASGWIGQRFCDFFEQRNLKYIRRERTGSSTRAVPNLRAWLAETKPDFVINAAGFTGKPNVDACERAKAACLEGNVLLPVQIGEACAELGVRWGHVSSGCIYQGNRGTDAAGETLGFRETDEPNFCFETGESSFYSGTKAWGEKMITQNFPETLVWRLRIPFNHLDSSRNYLSKMLRYKRLFDARNSLSQLDDFIASCWATMERQLPGGIYNLTNPGSVTTREVIEMLCEESEKRRRKSDFRTADEFGKSFHFFDSEEDFRRSGIVAPRSNCVLDTAKAQAYGLPLRPVREALQDALQRWVWEQDQ